MTKIKQAFDEQFGNLASSHSTIKKNVLNKLQKRKRKIYWQYPVIASIVLFVAVGFLWSQMQMNNEQQRLGTLSKKYFEVMYFDTFYLSQMFNRSAENYEEVYHHVVQEAAVIDYAKKNGIAVTEEETEEVIDRYLAAFKEGKPGSEMAAFRFDVLFKEFNLNDETYARLLAEQQLVYELYEERLFDKLQVERNRDSNAYWAVVNDALTAFDEQYAIQLDDMLADFKPVRHDGFSGTVEMYRTSYGDFQVVELEGQHRFAAKQKAVDQLLVNAMADLNAIMEEEDLGYLSYYTLDDYIKSAEERIGTSEKAEQLHELLTILKLTVELY